MPAATETGAVPVAEARRLFVALRSIGTALPVGADPADRAHSIAGRLDPRQPIIRGGAGLAGARSDAAAAPVPDDQPALATVWRNFA
jgi:hypothetical protein